MNQPVNRVARQAEEQPRIGLAEVIISKTIKRQLQNGEIYFIRQIWTKDGNLLMQEEDKRLEGALQSQAETFKAQIQKLMQYVEIHKNSVVGSGGTYVDEDLALYKAVLDWEPKKEELEEKPEEAKK